MHGKEAYDDILEREKVWLEKFLEYTEIMSQGETLKELEDGLRETYKDMILEDVPEGKKTKQIAV
ncbi:MAG TPA: type II toxin-antitoxin system HicB family antitoxin [Candidatus Ozemobacteraceae bacterium]|nr:type II toxin-antitoxin system HicB family antitoxin [Candidatus Ozemobacteraceae bacterium]